MKTTLFLLLAAIPFWAQARPYKLTQNIVCDKSEAIAEMLIRADEQLEWVAQSDLSEGLTLSVWSSRANGTVTIVVSGNTDSCIIGAGSKRKEFDQFNLSKPNS
jgi:hypothetical protein